MELRMNPRILTLVVSLLAVAATTVSAQVPESGVPYALIVRTSPRAADVDAQSQDDGANILQWSYANGHNQHWIFEDEGSGHFRIKARHSGKYMTADGEENGANVVQKSRSGSDLQQWRLDLLDNGFYTIINKGSGKALEVFGGQRVNGDPLAQWEYMDNPNQHWRLFPTQIDLLAEGAQLSNRTNLGKAINSECDELSPLPTVDGSTLYVTVVSCSRNTEGGLGRGGDIWYANPSPDGGWQDVQRLGFPLNNSQSNAMGGASADGNTMLLFGTYNQGDYFNPEGVSLAYRTDDGWSHPEAVHPENYYNISTATTFMLLPNGKGIIMSIERADTYGSNDLYMVFRRDDGSWSEPQNMGMGVNSPGFDFGAYLAADGRTLYFASWTWPGYGQADIFMSKRLDDTWLNWSEARNLGPGVNTEAFEGSFVISGDGTKAYISSSEDSYGRADIFTVDVPESLRPDPVVLVSGTVVDANTDQPLPARIVYERLRDGEEMGRAFTTSRHGFSIALPRGEQYGVYATAPNYYAITENTDLTDLETFQKVEMNLRMVPLEVGASIRLNNIFFDTGDATLRPESYAELNRLAGVLRDNEGLVIEIGGHTDATGADDVNLTLSQRRAASVVDYLITQGTEANRLQSKGYGKEQPVASNDTEEGRQLNRRVEFRILER